MINRGVLCFITSSLVALSLIVFLPNPAGAQHKKHQKHHHILDSLAGIIYPSLYYPHNPSSGTIVWGLGIDVTIIPRQIVRDEVRQIPQIAATMRIGLPVGFGVSTKLIGNYIANQFSVTPSWSYSLGHFSFAIQNTSALWIGAADFSGFNTFGMGFSNAPGVAVGMRFDDFLLTVRGDMITNYWHYTKFGSDVAKRKVTEFEGQTVTFAIEQDAFNGSRIQWGLRFNYTRPDYQLWLAFSDTRQRILIPEFFFGIIL